MTKGFWNKTKSAEEANWDILLDAYGDGITPYIYLHGLCHIFACLLHQKYGYDIMQVVDDQNNLVHAFCIKDRHYIDIRGITNQTIQDFLYEFEDWVDTEYIDNTNYYPYDYEKEWAKIEKDSVNEIQFAKNFIETHTDYYTFG